MSRSKISPGSSAYISGPRYSLLWAFVSISYLVVGGGNEDLAAIFFRTGDSYGRDKLGYPGRRYSSAFCYNLFLGA